MWPVFTALQLSICLTYIVIDFGWRLHICWLVCEYQSWEYPCDFVLSVQLMKDKNKGLLEYGNSSITGRRNVMYRYKRLAFGFTKGQQRKVGKKCDLLSTNVILNTGFRGDCKACVQSRRGGVCRFSFKLIIIVTHSLVSSQFFGLRWAHQWDRLH